MTQGCLDDLAQHIEIENDIKMIPLALYLKKYNQRIKNEYIMYYMHNGDIIEESIFRRYNRTHIYNIFGKHNLTNFNTYISNNIVPEHKMLVNKYSGVRFIAVVYAINDDNILFSYHYDTNKLYLESRNKYVIDYTNDNFNVINEL